MKGRSSALGPVIWVLAFSFALADCQGPASDGANNSPGGFGIFNPAGAEYDLQKFIVKYSPKAYSSSSQREVSVLSRVAGFGAKIDQLTDDTYVVELPSGVDTNAKIGVLKSGSDVEYVERDYKVHAFMTPNDPDFSQQWAHQVIHSEQAWDIGQGSDSLIVADIDTGLDYNHPDIAANVWTNPADSSHGWNFVANNNDPMADDKPEYHGTHTAGIIGAIANNGVGVAGVSPHVKIMPLKFLGPDGSGDTSNAVKAIYWGIQHGAKVMNNSWGGAGFSQALSDAITSARSSGVLFIAAAGNGNPQGVGQNNDQTPTYPASYPVDNIIAVAATDNSDNPTSFSNYGPTTVQVAAPGLNILSLMNGNSYQLMSGTSMATPMVTGIAALILGLNPNLTYSQVKDIIMKSVDPIPSLQGKIVTGGRVNSFRAMQLAAGVSPQPSPSPTPDPSPTPTPTPTPTNTPPPNLSIAPAPAINGQSQFKLTNPNQQISVTYDVTRVAGAVGIYFEVSKANATLAGPNGVTPDPNRLGANLVTGVTGNWTFTPAQVFPGWGAYSMRLIPLNQQEQPMALFSNPAVLLLSPN